MRIYNAIFLHSVRVLIVSTKLCELFSRIYSKNLRNIFKKPTELNQNSKFTHALLYLIFNSIARYRQVS